MKHVALNMVRRERAQELRMQSYADLANPKEKNLRCQREPASRQRTDSSVAHSINVLKTADAIFGGVFVSKGAASSERRKIFKENKFTACPRPPKPLSQQGKTKAKFLEEYMRKIGLFAGRWASMEAITDLVVFLASDQASHSNGAEIPIDGGYGVNAR